MTTRSDVVALDNADPLAGFPRRFVLGDDPRIYLDGNSLGRLPLATRDRRRAAVDVRGERLVAGWHQWIDAPRRVGDRLAQGILGVEPREVVVADYRSGALVDLPAITALARRQDVAVLSDVCHSAGIVPLDLRAHGVELAVGCTYKYLNAGRARPRLSTSRANCSRASGHRSPVGLRSAISSRWATRTSPRTA